MHGSDAPEVEEKTRQTEEARLRIAPVVTERLVSTPVLHIMRGADARTRHYLSRLLPALAKGEEIIHSGAVAAEPDPLLERQASRAGLAVVKLEGDSAGWLDRRRWVGACARTGQEVGAKIVHAHSMDSVELAASVAGKLRIPLLVSMYSKPPDGQSVSARAKGVIAKVIIPLGAFSNAADEVLGAPAEVIPWGLDRRDLEGEHVPQRVAVELGLDPTTLHFGMAGDLSSPACGGDTFVDAAALALKEIPFCDYAVIGTGSYAEVMERKAHALRVLGRFSFVPYSRTLARAIAALDVIVFPGRPKSFPWEVAHAAACRVRLVACDCPEHREVLGDGENITWVEEGDAEGLSRIFLSVLAESGTSSADPGWLTIAHPDGGERVIQARPALTGVDISEGELDEYDITPDDYSKRRVDVLKRYSFSDGSAKLSRLYRAVSGDMP